MPQLSQHYLGARFCPILGISNQVKELNSKGIELVNLSVGVPNFRPAPHVYEQAVAAVGLDSGTYGSSRGEMPLIAAYLQHLSGQNINGYEMQNIVIGLGAKHLLYAAICTILEEGDEVLIPTPYWTTYTDIVAQAGGQVVALHCRVENEYKIDVAEMRRAITPRTKAIILNNPCNPSGATYSRHELAALAEVFQEHDVWIISDDVYSRFVAPEVDFCHLLHVAPNLRDKLIKIDSISKMYGMPGWRVGMLAAPEAVAQAIVILNSNSISNIPEVAAAAATAALNGDQSFSLQMRDHYLRKRDIVFDILTQSKLVKCPKPSGAFYLFPDISACFGLSFAGIPIKNDLDLAQLLLEKVRVAVVPGSYFAEPKSIRLSYSCDDASLAKGAKQIIWLLDQLS